MKDICTKISNLQCIIKLFHYYVIITIHSDQTINLSISYFLQELYIFAYYCPSVCSYMYTGEGKYFLIRTWMNLVQGKC